jgi:hypothetical protein
LKDAANDLDIFEDECIMEYATDVKEIEPWREVRKYRLSNVESTIIKENSSSNT